MRSLLGAGVAIALAVPALAQSHAATVLLDTVGATGDHMGAAVAQLGDVDGDSRADFAIGHVGANGWRGQVSVYSGARGVELYRLDGVAAGDRFGHSIAALPDIDGDGVDDFVVGAPFAQGSALGSGQVYVRSGANGASIFVRGGDAAQDHMGWSVASVGDVDLDGVADFAGGAIDDDNFGQSSGSVRVWSGANAQGVYTVYGTATNQLFGSVIASVGDHDFDGVPDFAVGAPSIVGSAATGYVRVFSGFSHAALTTFNGLNAGDNFGASIAVLDDVTGDGRAELAIGATQVSPSSTGQVDVYSAAGGAALFRRFGVGTGDRFGASLLRVDDLDADGFGDLCVGAPGEQITGSPLSGSLKCFSGDDGAPIFVRHAFEVGWPLGAALAGGGDFNGDQRADVLVGAPGNLAVNSDAGGFVMLSTSLLELWCHDHLLSTAQPTSAVLELDFGPGFAGLDYVVLGSVRGQTPQTLFGGVWVPLASDRYFRFTALPTAAAMLQPSAGVLDGNGTASVQFTPWTALASPAYYGLTFFHSAVAYDPAAGVGVMSSNSVPITLVP